MFSIIEKNSVELAGIDIDEVKEYVTDSLVNSQRPPAVGYCSASGFYQYIGTDKYQWFAKCDHLWTPYGEVLTRQEK